MMRKNVCFFVLLIFSASFVYAANLADTTISDLNYLDTCSAVNEDGTINAVIEIPAGTNEKWEVTKPYGKLELEYKKGRPRIIKYLGYPGNYGMVPGTLMSEAAGGDGDPLDVLLIGAPVKRGDIVRGKIIGVLKFFDRGEKDDKFLAVLPETALFGVDNLSQLDATFPGITSIIKTWFLYYKGTGKMVFKGFGSAEEARVILEAAIQEYRKQKE